MLIKYKLGYTCVLLYYYSLLCWSSTSWGIHVYYYTIIVYCVDTGVYMCIKWYNSLVDIAVNVLTVHKHLLYILGGQLTNCNGLMKNNTLLIERSWFYRHSFESSLSVFHIYIYHFNLLFMYSFFIYYIILFYCQRLKEIWNCKNRKPYATTI